MADVCCGGQTTQNTQGWRRLHKQSLKLPGKHYRLSEYRTSQPESLFFITFFILFPVYRHTQTHTPLLSHTHIQTTLSLSMTFKPESTCNSFLEMYPQTHGNPGLEIALGKWVRARISKTNLMAKSSSQQETETQDSVITFLFPLRVVHKEMLW